MNKNRATKSLSILLAMCMLLGMLPMTALADNFSDIKGHWAESQINEMINEGIVKGYPDGSFKPDGDISRAEFVSLIVKAFKLTKAKGKDFDDISNHWAKDAILTANAHGIVNGYSDTKFGPDDPITREQMAVIIVKVAHLTDNSKGKTFVDSQDISEWAKKAVAIASSNQLITGYPDNTFKPSGNASRAEATAVLSKSLTIVNLPVEIDYSSIENSGKYGPETGNEIIESDVIIKAKDVILQNLIIKGDLIISKEVGDGDATLNNVKVEGKTYIRGGGIDSIHINQGEYREIIIERTITGAVRILTANVQRISITISENDNGEDVILNGEIKTVTIKADGIKVISQGETTIDKIEVTRGLKDVKIELTEDTEVKEIILDSKVDVKGKGEIEKASGSKIRESTFVTAPKRIITPSTGGNGSSSSGGSGSGGTSTTPTIKVSAITVTGTGGATEITTDGGTLQMIATVSPSNASNKAVTWNVDNTSIATIDGNGLLTAVANGTVEVTASAKDSSGVKGTTTVTISNQKVKLYYVGIKGIPAENKDLEISSLEPFGATVSYQWQISNDEYGDFTDISGAIGDKYIIQSSDVGKYIRLQVTGTDDYKGTIYSSSTKIRQTYAVSFNSMGGTPSNPDPIKVVPGYSYNTLGGSFPTVTKDDHTFHGWFTEEIGGYEIKATSHVSIGEDHTLYARWIKADDVLLVGATGISGTGETYLKNNGDTGDSSDYNIHYNSTSKTLTLNGYEGGSIEVLNKFGTETLNLVLEGTNKVNGTIKGNYDKTNEKGSGFEINGAGKLEIQGSIITIETGKIEIKSGTIKINKGSLSADLADISIKGGEINISGEASYNVLHTQRKVEISGTAKLNIDSYNDYGNINGIYARTIEIKDTSQVDIKVHSNNGAKGLYIAYAPYINNDDPSKSKPAFIKIGKDAKVNVETMGSGTKRAVYFIAADNMNEDPDGDFQIDGTKVAIPTGADYKYPESGVSVTGVSLSKASTTLTVGDTETLEATVAPANADNQAVTWSSSDTSVATVDSNGKVTAVSAGTATITVTTQDGGKTAECAVTVAEAPIDKYTVTFSVVNGNGSISAKANDVNINSGDQVAKGSDLVFTATPNTGYKIKQWKYNGTVYGGTEADFEQTNLYEDFNVTVEFEKIKYTLTYEAGEGGTLTGTSPQTVAHGENGTAVTAKPNEGYNFDGWSDGKTDATRQDENVMSDANYTASFKKIEYTVTYNLNDGTGTAPTESNKTVGDTFTAAVASGITAPVGKEFKEWNTQADGNGIAYAESATVTMPASDLTLYAIWKDVVITSILTFNIGEGGTISATVDGNPVSNGDSIENGKQVAITFVPEEYRFIYSAKLVVGENNIDLKNKIIDNTHTFTISEDTEIVASFGIKKISVGGTTTQVSFLASETSNTLVWEDATDTLIMNDYTGTYLAPVADNITALNIKVVGTNNTLTVENKEALSFTGGITIVGEGKNSSTLTVKVTGSSPTRAIYVGNQNISVKNATLDIDANLSNGSNLIYGIYGGGAKVEGGHLEVKVNKSNGSQKNAYGIRGILTLENEGTANIEAIGAEGTTRVTTHDDAPWISSASKVVAEYTAGDGVSAEKPFVMTEVKVPSSVTKIKSQKEELGEGVSSILVEDSGVVTLYAAADTTNPVDEIDLTENEIIFYAVYDGVWFKITVIKAD